MSFVPEWISHYIQAISLALFSRQSNTYAPLAQEYIICDLKSLTEFVFSLHDTKICTEMRFGIMQTNAEKYMEMKWTRSRIKVIPLSFE